LYSKRKKIENLIEYKNIKEEAYVYGFELLKDNRLLVSLYNSIIKIYNSENFEEISSQKILEEEYYILFLNQMKNGKILPTFQNKYIYLLNLKEDNKFEVIKEINGHKNQIMHVIELKNENIVLFLMINY